jgi:hypothetical protein
MRCLLLFALTAAAAAQSLADPSRAASLASTFDSPSATDFRCAVKPIAPQLNFGMRFQAGYVVVFPMRQFTGAGHHLDVTLRVTPDGAPPSYLTQALDLPEVPQATKADGVVAGSILVAKAATASTR